MSSRALARYAEILRNDFAAFAHRAHLELYPAKEFERCWHFEVLAAKLNAVRRGECNRLIINLPPRNLKSFLGSIAFPAFVLGHYPSSEVLCISYGEQPASKNALPCRTLMQTPFYKALFETRLLDDKLAVVDFKTTQGGGRAAVSWWGAVTGQGADYLIIDDPLKADEGTNEAARTKVNESYNTTVSGRVNKDRAAIILIMQRLHANDLAGFVQKTQGEHWDVVALPALAEQDEAYDIRTPFGVRTIRRAKGEALQPQRQSALTLATRRASIGSRTFDAQYQQKPHGTENAPVKREWFGWYDDNTKPEFDRILQSWDTATKAGETNSYSVCTTWGVHKNRFYLIDVVRQRFDDYRQLKQKAISVAKIFGPRRIFVEEQSSGSSLVSDLEDADLPVQAVSPGNVSKLDRLQTQVHRFERGEVLLPRESESEPWLEDYVEELTTFPDSEFSDQVDSTTQALANDAAGRSFENTIKALELLGGDPSPEYGGTGEMVKLRVLQAVGTIQFGDGRPSINTPAPGGIFEIDEMTANTLVQNYPKTYERVRS